MHNIPARVKTQQDCKGINVMNHKKCIKPRRFFSNSSCLPNLNWKRTWHGRDQKGSHTFATIAEPIKQNSPWWRCGSTGTHSKPPRGFPGSLSVRSSEWMSALSTTDGRSCRCTGLHCICRPATDDLWTVHSLALRCLHRLPSRSWMPPPLSTAGRFGTMIFDWIVSGMHKNRVYI